MKNRERKYNLNREVESNMYDLFRSEIKVSSGKMKAALSLYSRNRSNQDLQFFLHSLRSILSAAKIVEIRSAQKILATFDDQIRHISEFKNEQLLLIETIVDKIYKSIETNNIVTYFDSNYDYFIKEITEISEKSQPKDAINERQFVLITGEIEKYTKIIENILIQENAIELSEIKRLKKAISGIKTNSKLLKLNRMIELTILMENVFYSLEKNEISMNDNLLESILRCNDIIASISELNQKDLNITIESEDLLIGQYIDELKDALSKSDQPKQKNDNHSRSLITKDDVNRLTDNMIEYTEIIDHKIDEIRYNSEFWEMTEAISSIKDASKEFGLKKIVELATEFEGAVFRRINSKNYFDESLELFEQVNQLLRSIAIGSIKDLINNIENNSDAIDNYLNKLNDFLSDKEKVDDVINDTESKQYSLDSSKLHRKINNIIRAYEINLNLKYEELIDDNEEKIVLQVLGNLIDFIHKNDYDIIVKKDGNNDYQIEFEKSDQLLTIEVTCKSHSINLINLKKDIYYYQVKSNLTQIDDREALILLFDEKILEHKYFELKNLIEEIGKLEGKIEIKSIDPLEFSIDFLITDTYNCLVFKTFNGEISAPMFKIERLIEVDKEFVINHNHQYYLKYNNQMIEIENFNKNDKRKNNFAIILSINNKYALQYDEIAGIEEQSINRY